MKKQFLGISYHCLSKIAKLFACTSLAIYSFADRAVADGPWNANSGFSSTQGVNQWYYQYRPQNASTPVTNMVWNTGGYALWWTSDLTGWLGDTDGTASTHPGSTVDTIRRWVAPSAGTVNITGRVYKIDTSGGAGIVAKVEKNGSPLWTQTVAFNDPNGYAMDSASALQGITVASGDSIAFIVNNNGMYAADRTAWDPTISKVTSWNASANFSSLQGTNQWYYQQRPQGATSPVTNLLWNTGGYSLWWTSDLTGWVGGNTDNAATSHPGSTVDTIRKWISPIAGVINIKSSVYKIDTSGGGGVKASVEQNGSVIWGPMTVAYNDRVGYTTDTALGAVSVASGDSIAFILDENGAYGADRTAWDPTITQLDSYQASTGFSTTEGPQWYYQQRPRTGGPVSNAVYSTSPFGAWFTSETNYGWLSDTDTHPGSSNDTIRTWVAPYAGTVSVTGRVFKVDTSGGAGVIASVEHPIGTQIWIKTLAAGNNNGYKTDSDLSTVSVTSGDTIAFVVDDNGTWAADRTQWNPAITYAPGTWSARGQFSSVQGMNHWYYQQRPIGTSTYSNMTYSSGIWSGGNGNWISDHALYPDNSDDAVRTWIAPSSGTIAIAGKIQLIVTHALDASNNGVVLSVLRNNTTLWQQTLAPLAAGGYNGSATWLGTYVDSSLSSVPVSAGDSIRFVVNNNGDDTNDSVAWEPTISYAGALIPSNTTYYINATGSDSNSGTDTSHPWLTVAPLNKIYHFGANVKILFNRGDSFSGGLNIVMSGRAGAPDIIGDYGTATNAPILTDLAPGNTTTDIIQLGNSTYVTVHNLSLNGTLGTNYGTSSYVPGNESFGLRIYSRTTTGTREESMYIDNMYFTGSLGGVFIDTALGSPTGDGIDDLKVTGSTFYKTYQFGLFHLGAGAGGAGVDNQSTTVYVGNNQFSSIQGDPNFLSDAGAINLFCETGVTIEKNLAHDCGGFGNSPGGGSTAIGFSNMRNFIVQHNEVYNTKNSKFNYDGSAIDADIDVCNGEIAYNLTHDNEGPSIEAGSYVTTILNQNIAIHHNMSYEDVQGRAGSDYGAITLWGSTQDIQIFNNTLYVYKPATYSTSTPSGIFLTANDGTVNKDIKVWNNLIKTTGGLFMIRSGSPAMDSTTQFIGNLYDDSNGGASLHISNDDTLGHNNLDITGIATWRIDGQEKIGINTYGVVGAGLTSPSAPSTYIPTNQVSNYTGLDLPAASPAIGQAQSTTGIITETSPITVQTQDFHGGTSGSGDIGADNTR